MPVGSEHRHRLLVSLTHDRCLARLGLGTRPVALISAAHGTRCGSHLACAGRVSFMERREAQEGFAMLEVALPSPLTTNIGFEWWELSWQQATW
jgi:hypothetical protein